MTPLLYAVLGYAGIACLWSVRIWYAVWRNGTLSRAFSHRAQIILSGLLWPFSAVLVLRKFKSNS